MSKVQLAGNANGTGIFTIASPNSNTDRTINLPDAAGTLQVSGNPISGTTGTFTGLVDISASGAGQIKFPATQNPSSNANTLDDYEEGTRSPTITATSTNPTSVSFSGPARYLKIGKLVFIQLGGTFTFSGFGNFALSGLPFASFSTGTTPGGGGGPLFRTVSWTGAYVSYHFRAGTTNCEFWGVANGGDYTRLAMGNFPNGFEIYFSACYEPQD